MADDKQHIENEVIDAILEKPITLTIDGRFFYIYQPSLGISLLTGQLLQEVKVNSHLYATNKLAEMYRICETQHDLVLRIVALYTFSHRSDAIKEESVQARIDELKTLDAAELATLVTVIFEWETRQDKFIKHYQLDREKRTREKIAMAKKNKGNNLTFGGRSMYGTIIDTACERYGWEVGYVLWGVSLINLNMLLSDSVQSVFLTKEEIKEAHISIDGVYLDARDPKNLREIQRLIKGK